MTETKNEQHSNSFIRKLGNVTYTVKVHFSKDTDKTFKGRVQKLIINECIEKIRNNPHHHLTNHVRRYPFIVVCRYQDMFGNVHMFKNRNLYFDPSGLFKDQNVKVYVDGEEFKHYYVDIDEVLPNIIEH